MESIVYSLCGGKLLSNLGWGSYSQTMQNGGTVKLWTETSLKPWIEELLSNRGMMEGPSNCGQRATLHPLKLKRELLLSHFG
jgi:hypothetical protein